MAIETKSGAKEIQLFDETTGDMRNTYQVLEDISKNWNDMSNAQKQAIGIALAGKLIFASIGLIAGKITNVTSFIRCLKSLIPNYNSNIIMASLIH